MTVYADRLGEISFIIYARTANLSARASNSSQEADHIQGITASSIARVCESTWPSAGYHTVSVAPDVQQDVKFSPFLLVRN